MTSVVEPHTPADEAWSAASPGSGPIGFGESIGHHGEILQGPVARQGRNRVEALITIPVPAYSSWATYEHQPESAGLTVSPSYCRKAANAVRVLSDELGLPEPCGLLRIESNIPIAKGMGSSTSDVVAALKAKAKAHGRNLTQDQLAALAVRSERASDSTMYPSLPALFTHRSGQVAELLGPRFPAVRILGFDTADAGMDTLELAPIEYSAEELQMLDSALALMRYAVTHDSVSAMGRAATVSSTVNQRHRPKARFEELVRLAESHGVGLQVAHSGTVAGILFDPAHPAIEDRLATSRHAITEFGFAITSEISLGMEDGR